MKAVLEHRQTGKLYLPLMRVGYKILVKPLKAQNFSKLEYLEAKMFTGKAVMQY